MHFTSQITEGTNITAQGASDMSIPWYKFNVWVKNEYFKWN